MMEAQPAPLVPKVRDRLGIELKPFDKVEALAVSEHVTWGASHIRCVPQGQRGEVESIQVDGEVRVRFAVDGDEVIALYVPFNLRRLQGSVG